jgi:hypothetical protein
LDGWVGNFKGHYNISQMDAQQGKLLRLLAARLERLSVDSLWARRASGLRGNLLNVIDELDANAKVSPRRIDSLVERSFEILRKGAQEIPDVELVNKQDGRHDGH